jgi:hypothetical protein
VRIKIKKNNKCNGEKNSTRWKTVTQIEGETVQIKDILSSHLLLEIKLGVYHMKGLIGYRQVNEKSCCESQQGG